MKPTLSSVRGAAREHEDLRGFVSGGHWRGAVASRCVVKGKTIEVEDYPCFAAVALAGLDDLPDTIMSRSLVVRMRRRAPYETVEAFRHRIHGPEGAELREQLAEWTASIADQLEVAWPKMPDGVQDRAADVWEPLLALADEAGGDWPKRARVAAVAFVADAQGGGGETLGVRLLRDLRTVFGAEVKLATETILSSLHAMYEAPWGELHGKPLDARGLARRLSKYEVKPSSVRIGDRTPKGYERSQLVDVWARYLRDEPSPPSPVESATSATPQHPEPAQLWAHDGVPLPEEPLDYAYPEYETAAS